MKRVNWFFCLIFLVGLLSGCSLFTSHYDATRHENFTKLKASHVKLLEDWVIGSGNAWSENRIVSYCDNGDLRFREAFEFAKSTDSADARAQKAVNILWEEFGANCALLLKRKKLFSKVFVQEILPEIEKNYGYAIAGELSRVNAPK